MEDEDAPEIIKEAAMNLEYVNKYDKLKIIMQDVEMKEIIYQEDLKVKFSEGIKKGEEIAEKRTKSLAIQRMMQENFSLDVISKVMDLSIADINALIVN